MASKHEYNEKESKRTERAYRSPEIKRQRQRTVEVINPQAGERIVDIGCGPGFLVRDLAAIVGGSGRVVGIDSSTAMLDLARKRCGQLHNVEFIESDATDIAVDDASADPAICTQVLLYVDDVEKALQEMYRVLKPGGRVVILETDWRSTVLHSRDEELTEKIIAAWDKAVPSPRLPPRLGPMLHRAGFASVQTEAFPLQSSDCSPDGFSMAMAAQSAGEACKQGTISKAQSQDWLDSLRQLGEEGAYFFCVNRFLVSAKKQ